MKRLVRPSEPPGRPAPAASPRPSFNESPLPPRASPLPLRVLLVEDSEDDALLIARELRRGGYEPTTRRVECLTALTGALAEATWDVVICDFTLPTFAAPEALVALKRSGLELPFIIVSGTVNEELAVDALKAGASDFIAKGKLTRLVTAVDRELREAAARAERKRLEERLRQSQRMEAVGQLAGGIAHEFNNLLAVILSYGELMQADLAQGDPKREDFDELLGAARRAASLTQQLLAFSRRQVLEPAAMDLNGLLLDLQKMIERVLGEDIELTTRLESDLGRVLIDPGSARQIIMNLALNARDAMPRGGELTLSTANRVIEASASGEGADIAPGEYVVVSVGDNGTGMDASTRARVFEPFFTTKGARQSTGLGLSTVHGIVQQSGGQIVATSEPGRGSTFDIYLPRLDLTQPPTAPPPASARGSLPCETVLLIEDDHAVRLVACRVLRSSGYTVLEARTPDEARTICDWYAGTIHLILSDLVMPRTSGPEIVAELRRLRRGSRVLYMSGYPGDARLAPGSPAAGSPFVAKPFTPESLAHKVREVLDRAPDSTA